MATKAQQMQKIVRQYKFEHKTDEVDMHEVAKFAVSKGWPLPVPKDPIDLLARQFSESAREEIRHDKKTLRRYRGWMSYNAKRGDKQQTLWIDTDEASREKMQLAINRYREQMIGEAFMGTNTVDHWNRGHVDQLPLAFDTDLTEDVLWRLNGEEDQEAA